MKVFWVLTRLRMNEVLRKPSTAIQFFLLPPILLAVTGLVFQDGHPFELKRVSLVGEGCPDVSGDDVRVWRQSLDEAKASLATHVINAIFVCSTGEVIVEPRDKRFGEAFARKAEPAKNLTVVAGDRFGYVRYIFSGLVAYSALLAGLFGMGYTMVKYRQARFLKKLATTPLSSTTFVFSQLLARSVLVMLQMAILIVCAVIFIDLRLDPMFLVITMLGLWTAMAIGFAISSFVENAEVLGDAINAAGVPLIFLSEVFFPLDVMPPWLQTTASFLPSTQLVRLLRGVATSGAIDGFSLAGLCAWAVLCSLLALGTFRMAR